MEESGWCTLVVEQDKRSVLIDSDQHKVVLNTQTFSGVGLEWYGIDIFGR